MTHQRESDLCDAFAALAAGHGWTVYPETGAWDLLLAASDGTQIGVQAKLKANLGVITQALPRFRQQTGPHFRAILTACGCELETVCRPLKLLRFAMLGTISNRPIWMGEHYLTSAPDRESYRWMTTHPVILPCIVPCHSGGCPSPLVLSRWKIGALRVLARCELRGYVTTADGKEVDHDMGYMIRARMLVYHGREGRRITYTLGEHRKRPDLQHPQEYLQILAQEAAANGVDRQPPRQLAIGAKR